MSEDGRIHYHRYVADGPLTVGTPGVGFPLSLYVRKGSSEDALLAARSIVDQICAELAEFESGGSEIALVEFDDRSAGVVFHQEPKGVFSVSLEFGYHLAFAPDLPFWDKMELVARALDFFKRVHDRYRDLEEVELINGRMR